MKSYALLYVFLATTIIGGFILFLPEKGVSAESTILRSAGCKTEYFLLQELAQAYTDKTGTKIQLGQTGNKKSVNLLLENKIDFAFTCKPIDILAPKLDLDPARVGSWKSIPVARDPIVIVANSANGVDNLSTSQLTALFSGEIENWQELGGDNIPVRIAYLDPKLESGVNLLFKEFTVGSGGRLAQDAMLTNGPSMAGNYVAVTPGSVTFMAFNSYQEKYGVVLKIDGEAPTRENILNGHYSLSATYYLTLPGDPNESLSAFVDFILSEEGKKTVEKNFLFLPEN